MPHCAVGKCRNNGDSKGSITFHRFPLKFPRICKLWVDKCGRKDKLNPKTSSICSKHFTPGDYERDLRNEILGRPLIKRLRQGAIPSVFNLPPLPKVSPKMKRRLQNSQQRDDYIPPDLSNSNSILTEGQFQDFQDGDKGRLLDQNTPQYLPKKALNKRKRYGNNLKQAEDECITPDYVIGDSSIKPEYIQDFEDRDIDVGDILVPDQSSMGFDKGMETEKLARCMESLEKILNWIREKHGEGEGSNELPQEVLELVDPMFLVKAEVETEDTVYDNDSTNEVGDWSYPQNKPVSPPDSVTEEVERKAQPTIRKAQKSAKRTRFTSPNQDKTMNSSIPPDVKDEVETFVCPKCHKLFHSQYHMTKHRNTAHPEIEKCPYCTVSGSKYKIHEHIDSVHLGRKLHCNLCAFQISSVEQFKLHFYLKHHSEARAMLYNNAYTVVFDREKQTNSTANIGSSEANIPEVEVLHDDNMKEQKTALSKQISTLNSTILRRASLRSSKCKKQTCGTTGPDLVQSYSGPDLTQPNSGTISEQSISHAFQTNSAGSPLQSPVPQNCGTAPLQQNLKLLAFTGVNPVQATPPGSIRSSNTLTPMTPIAGVQQGQTIRPIHPLIAVPNGTAKFLILQVVPPPDDAPSLKCSMCDAKFVDNVLYKTHLRMHREATKNHVKCKPCNLTFLNRGHYTTHLSTEPKKKSDDARKLFNCDKCDHDLFFKSEMELRKHVKTEHPSEPETFLCASCGKSFTRRKDFNTHVQRMHVRERIHQCELCPSKFVTVADLRAHIERHGAKRERQCPHCGVMKHLNNYKSHIEYVHEGKRFKCNFCDALISQKCGIKSHLLLKHLDIAQTTSTADAARVIYVEPTHGRLGQKRAKGQSSPSEETPVKKTKPASHKCSICNVTFHDKNTLEVHRIRHEIDPEYRHQARRRVKTISQEQATNPTPDPEKSPKQNDSSSVAEVATSAIVQEPPEELF